MRFRGLVSLITVGTLIFSLTGCQGLMESKLDEEKKTEKTESLADESETGPYDDMGFDLSKPETVVMYVLGDRPAAMDDVLEAANEKYFGPHLNATLKVEFLNWSDYQTKYPLLLSGGEQVDLIYTSTWCFYNEQSKAGAFKELDMDFIKKYMPLTYEQEPKVAWDEISINGKIYAVPKSQATFTFYNAVAARKDLIEKYDLTVPDSWDNLVKYLKELAKLQNETGVTALCTNANRDQLQTIWNQANGIDSVTEGYYWMYTPENSDKAPASDKIFYLYTSDYYKKYCLDMADLASAGVWSSDAVNDTSDQQAYFENGKSGAFVWNNTIFSAGNNLEKAGVGTYEVYDITPDLKRERGVYSGDAIAITSRAADPERAALVLDYIKGDVNLNRLMLGGIEGVHWKLEDDGTRSVLDGASEYLWNSWAWALNRWDEPDESGIDPREKAYNDHNDKMEFVPEQTGFTFDVSPVSSEYTAITAIVDEYLMSFALGIYGDKTEATYEKFKDQIEKAGIEKVTKEFIRQYDLYLNR